VNDQFKVGDVVVLRSGSIPMTVEEIDGKDVSCVWMDEKRKMERGTFPAATLQRYEGPKFA
jgi:uncharacterized protein YodC (DUF2158 family)